MKKVFEITGVISLVIFSYIYTNNVASLLLETDELMVSINDYKEKNDTNCIDGYITEDGIVLGISGLIVDKNKSYSNMRGNKFDEELIIYTKDNCKINKEKYLDKYIIKGNSNKKSVSLLVHLKDLNKLDNIINYINKNNVDISIIIDNLKDINSISLKNMSYVYSGSDIKDLNKISNKSIFCISLFEDNLNKCKENSVNTIKTNKVYNKNIYYNIQNNLESGDIIVLNNDFEVLRDIGIIVNFIKAKGLKIVNIYDLLQ